MPCLTVDRLQNGTRSLSQQIFSHLYPKLRSGTLRATRLGAQEQSSARVAHQTPEPDLLTFEHRIARNRDLTATVQMLVQRALGSDPHSRVGMVQRRQQGVNFRVAAAALNTDRALPTCRQTVLNADWRSDAIFKAQTNQARSSKDDGVIFTRIQLGQTGIDVTAQEADFEVGATG